MSAPVDVLAVMERLEDYYRRHEVLIGPVDDAYSVEHKAARLAVAELIEATDCFTCAIAEDSSYRDDLLGAIRELEHASFVEQLNRVRAALANIGGSK